jgi:hypothetical protein
MDYLQLGGGACSLCGAEGTNKSTCPLNKEAKNPNPAKHNAKKANVKAANVKAANVKAANVKPVVKKVVVKKAVAGPKTIRHYHNVLVDLRDENGDYLSANYSVADAKKIIQWYNKVVGSNEYFKTYIKDFKMIHIKKNLFEIDYKQIGEIFVEEIIDPDDDSNSPITLGGVEYIVSGHLLNK